MKVWQLLLGGSVVVIGGGGLLLAFLFSTPSFQNSIAGFKSSTFGQESYVEFYPANGSPTQAWHLHRGHVDEQQGGSLQFSCNGKLIHVNGSVVSQSADEITNPKADAIYCK